MRILQKKHRIYPWCVVDEEDDMKPDVKNGERANTYGGMEKDTEEI